MTNSNIPTPAASSDPCHSLVNHGNYRECPVKPSITPTPADGAAAKNPFIFSDMYPDKDLQDYNAEEAYEMGVSAGLEQSLAQQRAKDCAAIKEQVIGEDEIEYSNLDGDAGYWEKHGRNGLRGEQRKALESVLGEKLV